MQQAKELLHDEDLLNVAKNFFDNQEFYNECVSKVKEIVSDNKLDYFDIPNVLLLLVLVLNKSPQLKVNKNNMKPLLKLLVVRLLGEVGFVDLNAENPLSKEQEMFIDSGLQLLGTYVKIDGCLYTVKNKVFGCLCKDTSPELEQHLANQKVVRNDVRPKVEVVENNTS